MNKQIPLSFPIQESYRRDDFMEAECNTQALQWINRFPDWPYSALVLYGEKGCGKTHLLSLWQEKSEGQHLAIDDAESIFGDNHAEEELFHQFNLAKDNKTYILLTMTNNIASQAISLPDLASRLKAAPQVEVHAPDDIALQAVLVKMFHDRQLKVEPDVIAYILPRMERSFAAARALVGKIDENAMAEKRSVTVPLVRGLIAEPKLF